MTGAESKLRRVVGANHRTVSRDLDTLLRHGLVLRSLHEPPADPDLLARTPEMGRFPDYLVAELVRADR